MKGDVQTISVDGGGNNVDPTSAFKLKFEDDVTGDVHALPMGGTSRLDGNVEVTANNRI